MKIMIIRLNQKDHDQLVHNGYMKLKRQKDNVMFQVEPKGVQLPDGSWEHPVMILQ